jgi:uncharacterized membrane protein
MLNSNSLILVGKVKCIYLLLNSLSFVICVLVALIVRGKTVYVALIWEKKDWEKKVALI